MKVFENRSGWVRCSTVGLDAHYIAGLVGLTAVFNDENTTTVDDVKKKLTEAIELAKELGV